MPRSLLIGLLIVIALGGAAWYYQSTGGFPNKPFDPVVASSDIQARIGSGPSVRNITTSVICGSAIAGDSQRVCAGHRKTAHEVRTEVNKVINATDARPLGDWISVAGGYTRTWRYGDTGFQMYSIIIMNDAISIEW